ncbi:hypothetical protein [Streptomyces sp. NPDC056512]|uniref:hypothetical protein n=1 Tax=Streptomyces sp. NPDC056512 TaxID=3345846 RepID=UPI0036BE8A87
MTETFPEPERNWRPGICASCESDVLRQEKEQKRAEQEAEQAAQKAGGWLSRFRT